MSKQTNKPLALAVGAALVGGIALSASAFAMTDLASGYMVSASHAGAEANCGADKKGAEAKCGADKKAEGSCGGDKKAAEGKCGEGNCGAKAISMMDTDKDGKVSRAECTAHHDAMFTKADTNGDGYITSDEADAMMKSMHEGKCGGDKAKGEGKCGADKPKTDDKGKMEGKCGEGKCGGMA
ncbi:HvfA family oxazolone/thioamide-modified RiPP metallophore [Lysobacter fragariae]